MDKTIQRKSQKDIFFELSGILKLEDYKFKEDTTHQAYFPSATVFNKVRNLFLIWKLKLFLCQMENYSM